MISFVTTFSCVEFQVGRINISMLSDLALMELFFTPDNHKDARKQLLGDEDDACTWGGVTCDDDKNVTSISWHSASQKLVGEVEFLFVPQKLYRLNMYQQQVRGEIDLGGLPESLRIVCVQHCHLSGTLDFQKIPRKIEQVFFNGSRITSVVNLHNLPTSIQHMRVGEEHVENASLRVGAFPRSDFSVNFSGTPKGIRFIFDNAADERRCKFTK